MKCIRSFFFVASLFAAFCSSSFAAVSPERMAQIAKLASDAAKSVCIPNGRTGYVEFDAKTKVSINNALAKLAQIDVTAASKFNQTEYMGVLQKDLQGDSRDPVKCQQKIYNDFLNRTLLNEGDQTKIVQAVSFCNIGELHKALDIFNAMIQQYGEITSLVNSKEQCVNLYQTERDIEIALLVAPAVFSVHGSDQPFLSRFWLYVDGGFCGILSNTNGPTFKNCSLKPGKHNYQIKNLSVFTSAKQLVFSNGSCGGHFSSIPANDNYAVNMCIGNNFVYCKIQSIDLANQFSHDSCDL